MPHLYTDEQRQIREEVRRVLAAASGPAVLRSLLEQKGVYDEAITKLGSNMGWPAMAISEADGGLGLGLIDVLIVAEECGRALVGTSSFATGFAAAHVLAAAGNQQAVLKSIASGGTIATIALGEDSEPLSAEKTRFTNGNLDGQKTAVLAGGSAHLAIVLALDETGDACLVKADLNTPAVTRTLIDTIDNSRCLATLTFHQTPAERLGTNDAIALAQQALARLALFLASEGVGGTDSCIALAIDHANQRQAFGQAIGKFQAVKHAIAEMYVLNEMARASVLDSAVRAANGDADAEAYIGAARLNSVQAYETAAAGTTQIYGGIGVTWEADLHLHYRRSRALAAEAGSPHYWEDRIVEVLEAA